MLESGHLVPGSTNTRAYIHVTTAGEEDFTAGHKGKVAVSHHKGDDKYSVRHHRYNDSNVMNKGSNDRQNSLVGPKERRGVLHEEKGALVGAVGMSDAYCERRIAALEEIVQAVSAPGSRFCLCVCAIHEIWIYIQPLKVFVSICDFINARCIESGYECLRPQAYG